MRYELRLSLREQLSAPNMQQSASDSSRIAAAAGSEGSASDSNEGTHRDSVIHVYLSVVSVIHVLREVCPPTSMPGLLPEASIPN